jgi:Ser/Thr protein kinase RdoA (MazF antagonist)
LEENVTDFYALPHDLQAQRLRDIVVEALQHWGLDRNSRLQLIKYRENAVFSVEDPPKGQKYVIRIHRAHYHTDDELRSELMWMRALTQAGVLTSTVVPTLSGDLFQTVHCAGVPEPRQCDVQLWIEGAPLGSIEGGGTSDINALLENYRIVGALQAKLHNQSSAWIIPAGFVRHAWDVPGMLGADPFWGRFWELSILTEDQLKLVLSARDRLVKDLQVYGQARDRYGLIHADFLPENMIVSDGGIRLIDFDDAGFGWHMFDVATSLFYHLGEDYFDNLKQAILSGYRSERSLSDTHTSMLLPFLLARGITYLSWLHTRKETETAQTLGPLIVGHVVTLANRYLASP